MRTIAASFENGGQDDPDALGYDGPVSYAEHHESHAASAFYPSPFEEAAVLTLDGVGEWATTTIGVVWAGARRSDRECPS